MGLPGDKIVVRGNAFSFDIPSVRGNYQATVSPDGSTLTGTWSQGEPLPLVFTRTAATPTSRPMAAIPPVALGELQAKPLTSCGVPSVGADGWKVAAPKSVGLSSATLCPMVNDCKQANVHAVVVVRHNTLVFEHYFTGSDQRIMPRLLFSSTARRIILSPPVLWLVSKMLGNSGLPVEQVAFGPENKHDERSVTKSVTALVLGVAIGRGWVKGVDELVLPFFPEYADLRSPEKDRITLRHLLTMSSGLEWHEFGVPYTSAANSEIGMDIAPDPYRFALMQPMVAPPGEIWNYNSGSSELLGAVLWKTTGKPLDQLARTLLFAPLGITDVEWYPLGRLDLPSAAAGLRLRPRDLAKIGQLILQHGVWNGKQVVPAWWIDTATKPQINGFYGYQFWVGRSGSVHWVAAVGLGGQRLFIVPDLDLVVVTNAGLYQSDLQGSVPVDILDRYVLKQPPKEHKQVAVNPNLFDTYVGRYQIVPNFILSITRAGDHLFVQATGQQKVELFPESDRDYFLKVVDAQITFEIDSKGRGSRLILHQNGFDQYASRVE